MALIYKEFQAPEGVSDFQTIVMRELTVEDEKTIALWCDKKRREFPELSGSESAIRHLECVRRSIAAVDGEPTSDDLPFSAFDRWKTTTVMAVSQFFADLNSLDTDKVKKAVAEAKQVPPPRKKTEGRVTSDPNDD